MPRCPVCDESVDLVNSPTVPFCSDRCRRIDLGRWLDEAYSVPSVEKDEEGDEDAEGSVDG